MSRAQWTWVRPWMLVSAAWIIPAILGAVDVVAQGILSGGRRAPTAFVLFVFADWMLYALLTPGVFVLSRRWPLARPRLVTHSLRHVGTSILFCAVWAGAGSVLRATLEPAAIRGDLTSHFVRWFFVSLPFGVAAYLAVVGIEHAIRYYAEAREREVQLGRLGAQLSEARFAELQARLNPHFLFNALNTIAVRVRDGEKDAARLVEQLSDLLRQVLYRTRDHEVSLLDELTLVRRYLEIEHARFPDRLRPEIHIPEELLSAAVPSFAIQHLVENAIRHGIARRTASGLVRIQARRRGDMVELIVIDDGIGIEPETAQRGGHGLDNTRQRLAVLHGTSASLRVMPRDEGGTAAHLLLPWKALPLEVSHAGA